MKNLLLPLLIGAVPLIAAPDWTPSDGTVAFLGSENMAATLDHGYFETLAALSFSEQRIQFRNLAWEGDTVFEQSRMLNFGSWKDQFARARVKTVIAQFGQMESFNGGADLDRFEQAYRELIAEWRVAGIETIVLVSPAPFESKGPPLPDLRGMNDDLERYVERVRVIAGDIADGFIDLFHPLKNRVDHPGGFTRDGIHWTADGHWLVAATMAEQLGATLPERVTLAHPDDSLVPPGAETIRQLVLKKNELWFHHWRPMNWAFLWGDRTEQPSSRDHVDPSKRWFPEEINAYLPLIEAVEEEIWTTEGEL